MRGVLLALCGGLVIAGGLFAATVTSPRHYAAATATGGDRGGFGASVRDYLMANPEVLVEAMQELERRQDSQRDALAQKGVAENQPELYRDPDSPVGGNPNGDVVVVEFNDYHPSSTACRSIRSRSTGPSQLRCPKSGSWSAWIPSCAPSCAAASMN